MGTAGNTDEGEICSRIPPIFSGMHMLFCYAKKTQWRQVHIKFELELNTEWQGPVQTVLLLWFKQGIFKSCWESATSAVASTYSRTELAVGLALCL